MDSAPFLFAYSEENTNQTEADFREKFSIGDDWEAKYDGKLDEGKKMEDAASSLTYAATAAVVISAFLLH